MMKIVPVEIFRVNYLSRLEKPIFSTIWDVTSHQHHAASHVGVISRCITNLRQNLTGVVVLTIS